MFCRAVSQSARRLILQPDKYNDYHPTKGIRMDNNLASLMIDTNLAALQQLDMAEQDAGNATATVEAVRTILTIYRTTVVATEADPALSDVGKAARIATAAD